VELQGLISRLGVRQDVRLAARAELIASGAHAVGPVLTELCDPESIVDPDDLEWVLRQIGEPAFGPLLEVMETTTDPEVARRAAVAFGSLQVSDPAVYLPALRHPHPWARERAAAVFQVLGIGAVPYAQALLPSLADENEDVRQRVVWAFRAMGAEVIPLLREVRRSKTAGRVRGAALTALVDLGGVDILDEVDRRLVARLIRVKMAHELPSPMHLCGSWYALPTTDQDAVLDAFGLSDPVPVTMRLGASAWNYDHHALSTDHEHLMCSRAYVSPALNGWTLVFGHANGHDPLPDADEPTAHTFGTRCGALSRRFGAAHWYGVSCGDAWTSWCIAERGEVVRFYDIEEPENQVGDEYAAESGLVLAECDATDIAARASIDPSALSPEVPFSGHGVLALTVCGREHGTPPGALSI
jgi:hypothetical protein